MQEWFEALTTFEKIFWYIAIPFSLIFIIQLILTFIGLEGGSSDVGGDMPGLDDLSAGDTMHDTAQGAAHGFSFFTLRNFIAFFTVFGWTGIAAINGGMSKTGTIILAIVIGIAAMFVVSLLFYFIFRMAETGNVNFRLAIGKTATVYIPVRAARSNIGKVQADFQGGLREMQAVTDGAEDLSTGTTVKITGITGNNILIVEKINP